MKRNKKEFFSNKKEFFLISLQELDVIDGFQKQTLLSRKFWVKFLEEEVNE